MNFVWQKRQTFMEENKRKDIDNLLRGVSANSKTSFYSLEELFEQRLVHLGITTHQALKRRKEF